MTNKLTKLTNSEPLSVILISQSIQEFNKILKLSLYDRFD